MTWALLVLVLLVVLAVAFAVIRTRRRAGGVIATRPRRPGGRQ